MDGVERAPVRQSGRGRPARPPTADPDAPLAPIPLDTLGSQSPVATNRQRRQPSAGCAARAGRRHNGNDRGQTARRNARTTVGQSGARPPRTARTPMFAAEHNQRTSAGRSRQRSSFGRRSALRSSIGCLAPARTLRSRRLWASSPRPCRGSNRSVARRSLAGDATTICVVN